MNHRPLPQAPLPAPEKLSSPYSYHTPVFIEYILKHILKPTDKHIVDATLGEGGHSEQFLLAHKRVLGLDADLAILNESRQRLKKFGTNITYFNDNFKNIASLLADYQSQIDLILFDLGISKFHYFKSGRGFSFARQEPLDMRLNAQAITLDAKQILSRFSEKELAALFRDYGEEPRNRYYAKAIVTARSKEPFQTSHQFATFIQQISPFHKKNRRLHPATKIFQALRIYVNDEIAIIRTSLLSALRLLRNHGRLVVISYHSLEDREVKNLFKSLNELNENKNRYLTPTGGLHLLNEALHPELPSAERNSPAHHPAPNPPPHTQPTYSYSVLTKKVIKPSRDEILANPSARSAKMRVLIKEAIHSPHI